MTYSISHSIIQMSRKIFDNEYRKENSMTLRLDVKKIYLAMAEQGITATEIARQGGVSQQAVSNALNGNRIGKVKVVPAICKALGVSAKDIVIIED